MLAPIVHVVAQATQPTAADLRREIRRVRELTKKPFAVNINLFPSARPVKNEEYIAVCIEEGVRIVETSGRSPEPYMKLFKDNGMIVMHKVPGPKYARTAERVGCDAVCCVGVETGGHPGMDEVGSMVAVPRACPASPKTG